MDKNLMKEILSELLTFSAEVNANFERETGESLEAYETLREALELGVESCEE